jgi:adenylate kinase family enzyme
MKRIVIIGSPGAGKTSFARRLADKTKLPVIHLDYYYHQSKFDYYNNKQSWIDKVEELIGQDRWIMDGHYHSTLGLRLNRADTVIFLDHPRIISLFRAMHRRIKYHGKPRVDMPSEWKERVDWYFLKRVWEFNKKYRPDVLSELNKLNGKRIFVLKNQKEVDRFLKSL